MRFFRFALLAILCGIFGVAVYQTILWLSIGGSPRDSAVKPLLDGDQEIALIELATNTDDWGRLVIALKLIEMDWAKINPNAPALQLVLDDAFPPLTAEVPEIVFSVGPQAPAKLRLRWYKISAEHDAASWIAKLKARGRPPLAIIGGASSDRAVRLAKRLQEAYPDPQQPSPLLLITTATAEKTARGNTLISLYAQRTFRFSFTNPKMVDALLAFVNYRDYPEKDEKWAHNLWAQKAVDTSTLAGVVASMAGSGDPWQASAVLRSFPFLVPYQMQAVSWQDERYSQDMSELFEREFRKRFPLGEFSLDGPIRYSVGGFFHPAPLEQVVIETILARPAPMTPHSFLVLPTQTVRMRRFLINLRQRSPLEAPKLVVLNGDAISFHSIYRDRDVVWNILDLPFSLVFFSHRNPIDESAGFTWTKDERNGSAHTFPQKTTSGTHDILLYRDLFEAVLYAAFEDNRLLGDTLAIRERMRNTCWYHPPAGSGQTAHVCHPRVHTHNGEHVRFFDAAGDRQSHTGEHIVWLKPNFTDDRVDMTSKISVWTLQPANLGGAWQLLQAHDAVYNQYRPEDAP